METALSFIRRTVVMSAIMALMTITALPAAGPGAGPTLSPLQPSAPRMTGDELFAKLVEHNRARDLRLHTYSAVRKYEVTNDKGKVYARETVQVDYQAPDHKTFVTESEEGSKLVRDMVFKRLIESESETSSGRAHRDSSIRPANYQFNLLGEQDVGPYHCLVAEAIPLRKDKYLFEGKIWIDAEDFGIVRIAGHPAKPLSFWINRADFVRQFQKIGGFWLPAEDDTTVHVRLYGKKIFTIEHREYVINSAGGNIDKAMNKTPAATRISDDSAEQFSPNPQQQTEEDPR
jgi:outer membrane lipoprotein-sorting protein